jgi:hypothetical protein
VITKGSGRDDDACLGAAPGSFGAFRLAHLTLHAAFAADGGGHQPHARKACRLCESAGAHVIAAEYADRSHLHDVAFCRGVHHQRVADEEPDMVQVGVEKH